eukprot:TRINITY_DN4089_c0_g2_i1.p2 TRINITY_DN4089_c0_g2~~TRINITY_DN4089_c0_g2_i1.p2  ORF type:complete len:121 (-),score=35.46 TRINITY_DN4089_c0_g2_i1:109-471(-)
MQAMKKKRSRSLYRDSDALAWDKSVSNAVRFQELTAACLSHIGNLNGEQMISVSPVERHSGRNPKKDEIDGQKIEPKEALGRPTENDLQSSTKLEKPAARRLTNHAERIPSNLKIGSFFG